MKAPKIIFMGFIALLSPLFGADGAKDESFQKYIAINKGDGKTIPLKKQAESIRVDSDDFISLFLPTSQSLSVKGIAPGFTKVTIRYQSGHFEEFGVNVKAIPNEILQQVSKDVKNYLKGIPSVNSDIRNDKIVLSGSIDPSLNPYISELKYTYPDVILDIIQRKQPKKPQGATANTKPVNAAQIKRDLESQIRKELEKSINPAASNKAVRVDAMIVQVSSNYTERLGFKPLGTTGSVQFTTTGSSTWTSTSTPRITTTGSISLAEVSPVIDALEDQGDARTLATPKLMVESGKNANFLVGGEYPITQVTANSSSVNYKKFGTELQIAPVIRANDEIFINLTTTISSLDFTVAQANGNPIIRKKEVTTNLTIKDGETFALAGLKSKEESNSDIGAPLIGKVPLIGRLFKSKGKEKTDQETIVFVTVRIVDDAKKNSHEIQESDAIRTVREEFSDNS